MTAPKPVADMTSEFAFINRELASLLRMEPVGLTSGADPAFSDDLVICGILGGKDVGKSTLINALAKTEVSVDSADSGKGTERPMVYVHEAMSDAAAARLQAIDRCVPLDVTTHVADPIRHMVLVDLPDFDSEFLDHLHQVQSVAPLLDRVLWVVTPRKIGDRAWVSLLGDVVKDPSNVYCVLNKVDELLSDAEPFSNGANDDAGGSGSRSDGDASAVKADLFWKRQDEWVGRVIERAGCPQTDTHRFLVAAAFPEPEAFVRRIGQLWEDVEWTTYAADLNAVRRIAGLSCDHLDRLRTCSLQSVSAEDRRSIKKVNRDRELEENVARIRRHYDLDRLTERLEQVCDPAYQQQALNEVMGPEYCSAVVASLDVCLRSDTELADELLERRVESWPLLRLVYWPFGWLSRIAGRRIGAATPGNTGGHEDDSGPSQRLFRRAVSVFDVGGSSLAERIEQLRSRILSDHAVAVQRLDMEAELPVTSTLEKRMATAADKLVPHLEGRLLDEIRRGDRKPGILGKTALWLILLWFPFLQPILSGVLEMLADSGTIQLAHGMYRVVSALSAVHLLAGFAVVAGVYVALLAGMYARGLRNIRRVRSREDASSPVAEAVDELIVSEVVVPLATPFERRLERLHVILKRLGIED